MIIDTLSSSNRYNTLNIYFEQAFKLISTQKFELGKTEIIKDKLYIIISHDELRGEKDAFLEAHNRFVDIQILTKGSESFGWAARHKCHCEQASYNETNDIIFYNDAPSTFINCKCGEFVIFFPEDAHMPLIGNGSIEKIIIKCAIE